MIKLKITTHSGEEFFAEVESFDAEELNRKINDNSLLTVVIGDEIISRIDFKRVTIVK